MEKIFKVTEEEKKAIRDSLGHSDEEIKSHIDNLKEWLKKQPHLPQNEDETRLRMMLFLNKFSLEKTKEKWDRYYSAKHIVPEIFENREPLNNEMYNLMENMILSPLPNLTDDLCRIYFVQYPKDSSIFNVIKYWQAFISVCDLRMIHDPALGERVILDFENLSLPLVMQISSTLKKMYEFIKMTYSDRFKGIHIVNVNSVTVTFVNLINSILSEKMGKRVYTHKNYNDLLKVLGPRALPNEYGGTAGPIHEIYDEFKKAYRSKNDWLKELGELRSDESKRVGEPLDTGMFGTSGSFRQLNFD